jgi:hypothetical protein
MRDKRGAWEASSVGAGKCLVRHPVPRSTSSLLGHILKISQANGFSSPWSLFRRAGLEQHEFRRTGIRLEKVAAIAACSVDDLIALGYSDPDSERSCRLLGHKLLFSDLDLQTPRICPECIQTRGFIEAHWDLAFMIGCPVHLCRAISLCLTCGEPPRWFRQGLLRCHCGAQFQSKTSVPLRPSECDLLQIIRTKVLRLLPLTDFVTGLPTLELRQLELRSLLRVIAVVGDSSRIFEGYAERDNSPAATVSAAAIALSAWPDNFFNLLKQMGGRANRNRRDIRDQFAPLYNSLFRRKPTERTEDLDFLRIAFLDFVSNQWNRRKVDLRTLKRVRNQVSTRYMSRAELARSLRVDHRTIKRHADLKQLPIEKRSHSTPLFDSNQFRFIGSRPEKILNLRQAAKEIGVSVVVLRSLKGTGDYEVRHQLHRQPGFHKQDVRSFKDKVLALAPTESSWPTGLQVISVGESLQKTCASTGEKAHLIRDMLARKIPVIGHTERTLHGLLIAKDELHAFIESERRNEFGLVTTCADAAKTLNCEIDTVKGLIERKLLCARKTARSWEIAVSSVEEFSRLFVRLSWVAALTGTNSRRLMALCARNKLELCEIKLRRGGVQPFVRRKMVDTILEYAKTNA